MAIDHVVMKASICFINDISKPVLDTVGTSAIPAYERARAFLMELRRHIATSSDQRQHLLNLISIFHKIKDPILSEIADSMKSEL